MKYIFSIILTLTLFLGLVAQNSEIFGVITDAETGETLIGVNVTVNNKNGISTNENGEYSLKLNGGNHIVVFSYIGYRKEEIAIALSENEKRELDVKLNPSNQLLDGVVVSAGRFEQRLGDVTVSMEVIKSDFVESINAPSMDAAINKVPGVNVADGQASIRGGSGYSYGAGSRVLLLVNNLPMLSPDAGDIKWNFIPLENIAQIEIIKGASSALFGSSALNGVINIRTSFPGITPETKVSIYNGFYMTPKRKELKWWGNNLRFFTGTSFSHSRKAGNLDIVTGGDLYHNAGYRTDNSEDRFRYNLNLRYHDKRIKGLIYGLNTNVMYQDKTDFFLWENAQEGALIQVAGAVKPSNGLRLTIDPSISYFNKRGTKHSLNSRFFKVVNNVDGDNMNNAADLYFAEYQYSRKFKKEFNLTMGSSLAFANTIAELFGNHTSTNYSAFAQIDKKFFSVLSTSFGVRWENYKLDTITEASLPLIRAGLNYQLAEYSFIRASFGQGYRFPTIAEKFTYTNLSGLTIIPSPSLQSETGWSSEVGIKQGIKISNWTGYIDVAGFWTEYQNMMEFTFGVYDTATYEPIYNMLDFGGQLIGFQARNVGQARITGIDANITGQGDIGPISTRILAGYTYTYPIDMNTDSVYLATKTNANNILKYRFFHSVKTDVEMSYNKFIIGVSYVMNGPVENIDAFFESGIVFPGLKEYREEHNKPYHLFDVRLSYKLSDNNRITVLLKNATNAEFMVRPGDIYAPRNIAIQLRMKF